MRSPIMSLVFLIAILFAAVKFVPPVNHWARVALPDQVLEIIGEEPIGFLEQGLDEIKKLVK